MSLPVAVSPSTYDSCPTQSPCATSVGAQPQPPAELEALFTELQPLVRGLIRRYGVDPDLREELPGEIFCHFVRLLESYDPARGVPLRPYLIRGLTTAVYTTARSRWRRSARETSLCPDLENVGIDDDPAACWDHSIWQAEVLDALPSLIQDLPSRQRSVLIWRYFDECSFEEIAVQLQVQPSTVRSLLRHGINNLRRKVNPSPGEAAV